MDINSFFSQSYSKAREKFLIAASQNNFMIESIKHPSAKGPNNIDLYIDYAVSNNKNSYELLIIISGTHGPEGYCGSAVQYGILNQGLAKTWAKQYNIALIHGLNPYGFAWDTRFNEDNIDLNRNFIEDFNNLPQNPEYDKIAQWALPENFNDDAINQSHSKLMQYAAQNGFQALQSALSQGQYSHHNGVYFGGTTPSWSNITLKTILEKITKNIKKLRVIDIHTGLGNYGHGEIISDCEINSNKFKALENIFGDDVKSSRSGNSVSAAINGSLDAAINNIYKNIDTLYIALEFGTIDPISVFKATQAGAWLYAYGDKNNDIAKALKQLSRDAFYPQDSDWNHKIWQRSIKIIQQF